MKTVPCAALALFMFPFACRSADSARELSHAHTTHEDTVGVTAAKQAFLAAWTKSPGADFVPARVVAIVDPSSDFLSFDAFAPAASTIEGGGNYVSVWQPAMDAFKTARLDEKQQLRTWICGDGALTASIVHVRGEMTDGTQIDTDAHLTLGWRRTPDGWRVVHEHMSTGVKN